MHYYALCLELANLTETQRGEKLTWTMEWKLDWGLDFNSINCKSTRQRQTVVPAILIPSWQRLRGGIGATVQIYRFMLAYLTWHNPQTKQIHLNSHKGCISVPTSHFSLPFPHHQSSLYFFFSSLPTCTCFPKTTDGWRKEQKHFWYRNRFVFKTSKELLKP